MSNVLFIGREHPPLISGSLAVCVTDPKRVNSDPSLDQALVLNLVVSKAGARSKLDNQVYFGEFKLKLYICNLSHGLPITTWKRGHNHGCKTIQQSPDPALDPTKKVRIRI